ncbi:MAG: transglutaminase domain-containing protein [Bacteroidales bacterium]|nr:transglutaminase domain-containing protein [Bacteroidales bacterium]
MLPLQALGVFVLVLAACGSEPKGEADGYIDFLYAYMPHPDLAAHPYTYWEANVDKTLEVRERMGWDIPEREFRHFVLPLRVNNEPLDDFRTLYADTLCARVQGMTIGEAALEINHWCHEMATYQPSDGRTSSPLQTIQRGVGRCGEESVLAVAALRAAGIPARQVYTPRWAHTDDNHAWVEVYVDGKWQFMGACEPEPRLNMAWFTGPVSRAMILHTKVFGDYHGDEDVIRRTPCYTEINVIRGYVPARRSVVTVVDEKGKPVAGAHVEFKIYNYAEYYTVASYQTDRKGQAALDMGLGDMVAWASKADRFGLAVIDGEAVTLTLDHMVGERCAIDLDIVPPAENPLPSGATDEEVARNAERLRYEDSFREARPKGNAAVIDAFLAAHDDANAHALLASLSEKDRGDVTLDVLEDAYAHIDGAFNPLRDCPRVDLEPLKPYFSALASLDLKSRREVAEWVGKNIEADEQRNPQGLRMAPADVMFSRKADRMNRDIFFVALCRANGLEARLDPLTGQAEADLYEKAALESGETPTLIEDERIAKGKVDVQYEGSGTPEYYYHFTLSSLVPYGMSGGSYRKTELCTVGEDSDHNPWNTVFPLEVEVGCYMLTSGTRLADGSVLSHTEFFTVSPNAVTQVPLVMRSADDRISVLGTMDADRFLPQTGRGYYLLAVLGDRDEPTSHAVRQLETLVPVLEQWGRPLLMAGPAVGRAMASSKDDSLGRLSKLVPVDDADGSILEMLCAGCKSESRQKPVITVCDSFGRIVYFSQGYNTSLAEDLKRVLSQL